MKRLQVKELMVSRDLHRQVIWYQQFSTLHLSLGIHIHLSHNHNPLCCLQEYQHILLVHLSLHLLHPALLVFLHLIQYQHLVLAQILVSLILALMCDLESVPVQIPITALKLGNGVWHSKLNLRSGSLVSLLLVVFLSLGLKTQSSAA